MDDEFSKFYEECAMVEEEIKEKIPADKTTNLLPKEDNKSECAEYLGEETANKNIANTETVEKNKKGVEKRISTDEPKLKSGEHEVPVKDEEVDEASSNIKSSIESGNIEEHKVKTNIEEAVAKEKDGENKDSNDKHSENVRYEGDKCIYTNPETKKEFVWNNDMKQWVPKGCEAVFDGKTYKYKDNEGVEFSWNQQTASWDKLDSQNTEETGKPPPAAVYGYDGEYHTYTDPSDNSVYFWDREKNAWFPKVDDDFMAKYQLSYGFVDNTTKEEPVKVEETPKEKRKASEPSWFDMDDQHNTKVYVSNLPLDLTEKELIDFMQKCGLVLKDFKTNKFKVKMYTEPDGKTFKGDALCDYIKVESVDLALNVLDGADLKGKKVKVQRAKFQMKGDYNPALKPKKKRKKEKEKELKIQQKLLGWLPDKLRGEREKHERTVIVKNLFTPAMFDNQVELLLEYSEDIRSEASKCGAVRKVTIFDKHPEGVAMVTFSDAEEADICLKLFHNRWFGKRRLIAETWDGKTKYKIVESEEEAKKRLETWSKFLEAEERIKL